MAADGRGMDPREAEPHVAAGTSSARRSVMRQRTSVRSFFIHGALAGALGAATMTVLRMVAHRAGSIHAMVPQAVEVWAKNEARLPWPRRTETHHVADELLHLG